MKPQIQSLYNGIMNDFSVKKYTLGWKDVIDAIDINYKSITRTNERFEKQLIIDAIKSKPKKEVKRAIEAFGRELEINLETLNNKQNAKRKQLH